MMKLIKGAHEQHRFIETVGLVPTYTIGTPDIINKMWGSISGNDILNTHDQMIELIRLSIGNIIANNIKNAVKEQIQTGKI